MASITKPISSYQTFLVFFLLLLFFITSGLSSLQESPTSDEPGHIATGIMYLKQGDLTFNSGSPLLTNVLSALPLSAIVRSRDIPSDPSFKKQGYLHSFASAFLQQNSQRINTFMFLARLPSLLFGIGVGLLIYFWSKKLYGSTAGIISLALYVITPSFLAHSHYATPDIALAFFFLLTLYSLYSFLETKKWLHYTTLLLSFSISQLIKNSAVYLLPLILAITFLKEKINLPNFIKLIQLGFVLGLTCLLSINIFYRFHGLGHSIKWYLTHDQAFLNSPYSLNQVENMIPKNTPLLGSVAQYVYQDMPLFVSYDYLKTIGWVLFRSQNGQPAYLFGQHSLHGWWYYYPVILFFKSTPLFLLLLFISLLSVLSPKLRLHKNEILFLLLPSVGMLYLAMESGIDTGIRQILFILPLLTIFAVRFFSSLVKSKQLLFATIIVLTLQALAVFSIFPNYLGYFNVFSGNPHRNYLLATDSNIDWGQDVKKLSHYLKENHLENTKMNLFGVVNTSLYGIPYNLYGPSWIKEDNSSELCQPLKNTTFVISVTQLSGTYLANKNCFNWLKEITPDAYLGSSIFLYRL